MQKLKEQYTVLLTATMRSMVDFYFFFALTIRLKQSLAVSQGAS